MRRSAINQVITSPPLTAHPPPHTPQGAALSDGYAKWQLAADAACARDPNAGAESSAELAALLQLMRDLIGGSEEAALLVGRRLVKHLWDAPGKAHASLHVDALALCADALGGGASIAASGAPNGANASPGARRLAGELTQLWVALATEAKFNRDVGERLLARGLLVLPEVGFARPGLGSRAAMPKREHAAPWPWSRVSPA